jgi:hypothetical protein
MVPSRAGKDQNDTIVQTTFQMFAPISTAKKYKMKSVVNKFGLLFASATLPLHPTFAQETGNSEDDTQEVANPTAESEVKGVNPAEILSRADLIVKVVNLPQGESITSVAKFDQKLGGGLGANVEFPFLSHVDVGAAKATGVGDLFARVRYVTPLSQKVIGLLSIEAVAPTASNDLLGTGKWQVNPGAGAVYMWSQRSFTAMLYKHSFSVAGDDARADIDVNQVRALHSFVLNKGWYITFDAKHEWQTKGPNQDWTTTEFEVGKQINAKWASSLRIGKAYGDRKNDGTLEFNIRTFF